METFIIIIISILVTLGLVTVYKAWKTQNEANEQSILLLDKIKRVCKFVTVEGDFAEIYHYEDVKAKFLKLISSRKKALVVINAKAYVGFDLSKIKMQANAKTKTVVLSHFPEPEVLSIESNINYYDKRDGMFNRFEAADLTDLHTKAKAHIIDKVPESGLFNVAKQEALEAIHLIENLVETIGWKIDYSALKIDGETSKTLK
ncbi:MAG: DUF4230 domain-containing protein [Winogradskyella arenosi]|uniref:Uncharacterized protein DUF4230 n=1 Tax=Winogradskyella arenosi TaxID=533325 RepID=A0A368ZJM0_9FLAO|nr:DUF4230 domain-containing protein [Winogradskyella arenosi]RCW93924.1 uncharacterized protein DUF4230 [Winogradskyella arenosi]